MKTMRGEIERYWRDLAKGMRLMPFAALEAAAALLLDCHQRGATIFLIGNGGSAATASHFACDLAKGVRAEGVAPFRVVALTDNVPLMTAWGNDTSYERVFAEQLATLARPGDGLVAVSASGNSPNILLAAHAAKAAGATTLALTGRTGGKLAPLADLAVRVPLDAIEQVEDAHVIIAHSLCVTLRAQLGIVEAAPRANGWRVEEVLAELVADLDV
ncbi:MAG TPA: SIS domain-containing protein [Thermomicrobiaceae bacterium]|nr:SIS domain-containing protein [Thermomicrobiaceae bacterium]